MQRIRLGRRNEIQEALLFPFVIADSENGPFLAPPFRKLLEEPLAFCLVDNEIARVEFAQTVLMKCGAVIFRLIRCQGAALD